MNRAGPAMAIKAMQMRLRRLRRQFYVVDPVLSKLESAVINCAGANGFGMMMLFGTPSAGQS